MQGSLGHDLLSQMAFFLFYDLHEKAQTLAMQVPSQCGGS